jgi:hypothetical protein
MDYYLETVFYLVPKALNKTPFQYKTSLPPKAADHAE